MNIHRSFYILCLSFVSAAGLLAQPDPATLFEDPGSIEWTRYYKGRIDDLNDIAIGLAWNGTEARGYLIYLRSKFQLRLEGTFHNDRIELKEIDQDDQISGFILGQIKEGNIQAEWLNFNKSLSADLRLSRVNDWPDFPTHCGDNKWIRVYAGDLGDADTELILQRYSYNKVKGTVYLENRRQSYHATGQLTGKRITLQLKDDLEEPAGVITGIYVKENRLDLTYLSESGIEFTGGARQKESISLGCIEYADYLSSYDFTYPKFRNETLNAWLTDLVDKWLENTHKESKALKADLQNPLPSQRSNYRSYGWSDVVCYSENIISGHIYYSDNWNSSREELTFNFDEKSNAFIRYEDVFKTEEVIPKSIDEYIGLAFRKHPLYAEPAFQEWISSIAFREFTFRNDGMQFSTPYNPIFGKNQVTIPYDKLKGFFREDSPGFRFL